MGYAGWAAIRSERVSARNQIAGNDLENLRSKPGVMENSRLTQSFSPFRQKIAVEFSCEHNMPRLAFSDWTAEQLRCTAFILPGTTLPAAHWWAKLTGADPEQVTANPRIGASQAVGGFGPGTLVVTTQPGRVDWFLVPGPIETANVQGQTNPEFTAPSLGGAVEAFDALSKISKQWLGFEDIPEVSRLALAGAFTHPEENKRAAYLRLAEYVPIQVGPESSDFLYQINLPTQSGSGIKGLVINRLSKWAVTMYKLVRLNEPMNLPTQDIGTTIALRSEIDVNTVQEFEGELPKGQLIEIVDELVQHGRSLITEGVPQ